MTIETAYGTITPANSGFGYGFVSVEDGSIVYRDGCGSKAWKTVKGFERWAAKMDKMNGGAFAKVETNEYNPVKTVNSWR